MRSIPRARRAARLVTLFMLLLSTESRAADVVHFSLAGSLPAAQSRYPSISALAINTDVSGSGGATGNLPYVFRFTGNAASKPGTASYANEIDYSLGLANPRNTGPITHPFTLDSLFLESTAFGTANAQLTFRVFSLSGSDTYQLNLTAVGQSNGTTFAGFSNGVLLQATSRDGAALQNGGSMSVAWNLLTAPISAPVPEPGNAALVLAGLLATLGWMRAAPRLETTRFRV